MFVMLIILIIMLLVSIYQIKHPIKMFFFGFNWLVKDNAKNYEALKIRERINGVIAAVVFSVLILMILFDYFFEMF